MWAQGMAFVAYLVLARLFSREEIGIYNIFYSFIDVLVIVSTCKYELAIVVSSSDREASAVSRLALRLNALISALMLALMLVVWAFMRQKVAGGIGGMPLTIALLIPPMVYFCGTSRVYAALFNRRRRFGSIATSEIVGSTTGVASKIFFGLPAFVNTALHAVGLPLGTVLGKAASNINYLARLKQLEMPEGITREERREAGRKFRNFPLYTMPKDFINSLSYNLPLIWLAFLFDKAEVGLFALALTMIFRPVNVLNSAFERLIYVRIAEKVRQRRSIMPDILRFVAYVNIFALPLFVSVFVWGSELFSFFFGSRWAECEYYVRCLLPWMYIALTSTSLMCIANVFSRQSTEFVFYIVLFLMRVAAMIVAVAYGNFRLGILLFCVSGAIVSAALLLWYLSIVRQYERCGM